MTKQAIAITPTGSAPPGEPVGFIDNAEMLRRIPVSLGTLQNWRKAGKLPFVALTKRRVLYHWPSVEQALLRMQQGGAQ
jgi:predicted site-specific integrase-resolvase